MLKIDADAQTYDERFATLTNSDVPNDEPYLQIMVAEGVNYNEDDGDNSIPVDRGIFFSFRVDSNHHAQHCPDYTDPYLLWNINGGGGDRGGVEIENDYAQYVSTLEAECPQLATQAPIPIDYRTISFDETLVDFDT